MVSIIIWRLQRDSLGASMRLCGTRLFKADFYPLRAIKIEIFCNRTDFSLGILQLMLVLAMMVTFGCSTMPKIANNSETSARRNVASADGSPSLAAIYCDANDQNTGSWGYWSFEVQTDENSQSHVVATIINGGTRVDRDEPVLCTPTSEGFNCQSNHLQLNGDFSKVSYLTGVGSKHVFEGHAFYQPTGVFAQRKEIGMGCFLK